jgi:DNA repair photolyase
MKNDDHNPRSSYVPAPSQSHPANANRIAADNTFEHHERSRMNGKPVFGVPAISVMNLDSGFRHKLLCDGPTFTAGSACVYSCTFCYVGSLMRISPHRKGIEQNHEQVNALRVQLTDRRGNPKFNDRSDTRVIYASPLVDVAANMELVRETIELCRVVLELTHWQIRLLSKSTFLPFIAEGLEQFPDLRARERVIYGVSTGTLDNKLAGSIEQGCPLVSRRIDSLHRLQDSGFRTFGMICPSLPQPDYAEFSSRMLSALKIEHCEHVWAEVINVRGESMTRTIQGLMQAGFQAEALALQQVSADKAAWEEYARATFEAHAARCPSAKLRFLQYVTAASRSWWEQQQHRGAVVL